MNELKCRQTKSETKIDDFYCSILRSARMTAPNHRVITGDFKTVILLTISSFESVFRTLKEGRHLDFTSDQLKFQQKVKL